MDEEEKDERKPASKPNTKLSRKTAEGEYEESDNSCFSHKKWRSFEKWESAYDANAEKNTLQNKDSASETRRKPQHNNRDKKEGIDLVAWYCDERTERLEKSTISKRNKGSAPISENNKSHSDSEEEESMTI